MTKEETRTLLLVDDEPLVSLTEKATLERFGYRVSTVTSGERAIEFVDSNPDINLILMDIDLGKGMDGTEAAEYILSVHDTPLVFISSHTEPEYVERTEGITSYGYIVKNSGDTVLRAAVKMAFRLFSARRNEQHKEEQLQRYFDSSLDLLCISDMQGRFLRLNPEWRHVLGVPVSEIEGRMFSEFAHSDDVSATQSVLKQVQEHGSVMSFENRLRRSDGSYRWIEWRARVQDGQVYAAGRDITEQKIQSLELEAEKQRFERLFRNAPIAIALVDYDDRIVQCNKEFTRLFGYLEEEVTGRPLNEHITPSELIGEAHELSREVLENATPLYRESQRVRKDGVSVDVAITGTPLTIHGKRYAYAIYQDISERKRTAKALSQSERRYRDLFEAAPIPLWVEDFSETRKSLQELSRTQGENLETWLRGHSQTVRDLAGKIELIDANEKALVLHGIDSKEQFLSSMSQVFNDRSYRVFLEELLWVSKGARQFTVEQQYSGADGVLKDVELHWSVAPGHEETFSRVYVSAIDISERKKNEQELRASEAQSRTMTENAYEEQIMRLLDQKDMLLKESHHRTKNQLAAIFSLLSYEASRQSEAKTTEVLNGAANRVRSIMLLHDKLYRSDNHTHVSIHDYINELVRDSVWFNDPSGGVTTKIQVDDFLIGPRQLAPLGMILHELVTNSIKHAFSDETGGRITVNASLSNDLVHLEYADDGIGLPDPEARRNTDVGAHADTTATGGASEHAEGFGRRLIAMLTEEMGGTLYTENASGESDGGMRYVLEFPVQAP